MVQGRSPRSRFIARIALGEIQKEESQRVFLRIIEEMVERGAQGVVEGCTEIGILVKQEHTNIPLFDTAEIHAQKAVELALSE
jgi:aspartate racemase